MMGDFQCKIATTKRELQRHFAIRRTVFVEEQSVFDESDVDTNDRYALPIVARYEPENKIVGAVRCYREEADTWYGGRLAVLDGYRSLRVGSDLVRTAEDAVQDRGCKLFLAHIQVKNVPLFKYLDWVPVGETEQIHGLEHQLMRTTWSERRESYKRERLA